MPQTAPFTDFSGGFTDNLFHNAPNKFFIADNLIVTNDRKLKQRDGSVIYDSSIPFILAGSPITRILKFSDETLYLYLTGGVIYQHVNGGMSPNTWNAVTGVLNGPFSGGAQSVSYSEYPEHLYIANSNLYQWPVKLFYKSGTGYIVTTAGLPQVPLSLNVATPLTTTQNAITFANAIRTSLIAHFGNSSIHVVADTVSGAAIPAALAAVSPAWDNTLTNMTNLATQAAALQVAYINHYRDFKVASKYHYKETTSSQVFEVPPATQLLTNTIAPAAPTKANDWASLVGTINVLNALRLAVNAHQYNADIHNNSFIVGHHIVSPYLDNSTIGTTNAFTLGPTLALDFPAIYAYANLLKAKYNAHLADGPTAIKAHSTAADATNNVTVADATSPETFQALLNRLYINYSGGHELDAQLGSGWAFHAGHETSPHQTTPAIAAGAIYYAPPVPDFFEGFVAGDWTYMVKALDTLKNLFNAHVADLGAHYTTDPTSYGAATWLTNSVSGADMLFNGLLATYSYAFVYTYTYKTATRTYKDFGPTQVVQYPNVIRIEYQPAVITNIPALTNQAVSLGFAAPCYDLGGITIEIYRTTNGGNSFFYVGSIPNGTATLGASLTFTDAVTDANLTSQKQLYTSGGVLDTYGAPQAKCVHIANSTGYYGNVVDSDQITPLPNRILQSVKDSPSAVPASNIIDLDDALIGISSARDTVIAFCSHSIYRLDNQYTSSGQGGVSANAVSRTVGCISESSIVKTDLGVFFAGTDGFYHTDGYALNKLSKSWNLTYASIAANSPSFISGAYDRINKRVWWGVQRDVNGSGNDACVILDLNFGVGEDMPWTTASNSGVPSTYHFSPTALEFVGKNMWRGTRAGFVCLHISSLTTDPYLYTDFSGNHFTSPGTKAITVDYQSLMTDLGNPTMRKWTTWALIQLRNESNLDLAITANIDDLREVRALTPIKFNTSASLPVTAAQAGGNPNIPFTTNGMELYKRRMPAKALRSTYQAIRFTNNKVAITDSTLLSTASVIAPDYVTTFNPRAILSNGGLAWGSDLSGYLISFAGDSYATTYEIANSVGFTLTILDPFGTLSPNISTGSAMAWKMVGAPKGQTFHLLSHAYIYDLFSPSFLAARSPTT